MRPTTKELLAAMDEVAIRVSPGIGNLGRYEPNGVIHINPSEHQSVWDLAHTLAHEIYHYLGEFNEGRVDSWATSALQSPRTREALYAKLAEVQMIYLGGGQRLESKP